MIDTSLPGKVPSAKGFLLNGGVWVFGGKLVSIAGAFLLNLVLARYLKPADYGAYFVILNTMIILATIATAGMDQVVVRFVSAVSLRGAPSDAKRVVNICLRIALLGTILTTLMYLLLEEWFFSHIVPMPAIVRVAPLVAAWLFFSSLQRQLAETFRGLSDMRLATFFGGLRNSGIFVSISTLSVAVVLALCHRLTLLTACLLTAGCSSVIVLVAYVILASRLNAQMSSASIGRSRVAQWDGKDALRESWPLWVSTIIAVLQVQGNGWLVGAFDTAGNVALFGVAQRFVYLLIAPLVVVNSLLPPLIAKLHATGEVKRLERLVQSVCGLVSLPCMFIFAILAVGGEAILDLLFGPFYRDAYSLMVIMCVGQIINLVTGAWHIVLPMTGHRHQMLAASIISSVVQLVASVLLGMRWGVFGVAWGFCIGVAISNVLGMIIVRKYLFIWTFVSIRKDTVLDAIAFLRQRFAGRVF